jgi:hypothetical protein
MYPRRTWDLRRRTETETIPVKDFHTRIKPLTLASGHGRYWFMINKLMSPNKSVTVIQGGPPGYFVHISITTPIVFALKNYYI